MCEHCKPATTEPSVDHSDIIPYEYHKTTKLYTADVGELPTKAYHEMIALIKCWRRMADIPAPTLPPIATLAMLVEIWDTCDQSLSAPVLLMFHPYLHLYGSMPFPDFQSVSADTDGKRKANRLRLAKQWYRFLSDCYGMTTSPCGSDAFLQECIDATLEEMATKGQSFAKRLAKRLAKSGWKLTKNQIETLNNFTEANTTKPDSQLLAFDQDYMDKPASAYGNGGSCWWGSGDYSAGRPSLLEAGGYACRTFRINDDGNRVFAGGRCWIAPVKEGHLIFNAYGIELKQFAKLLASMWQCGFVAVDVSRPSEIYINGDDGYLIGNKENLPDGGSYKWDIDVIPGGILCHCCGSSVDDDDSYSTLSGDTCCESCYCDNYASCSRCGGTYDCNDVVNCDDDYLCENCRDRRGYSECDDCGEWHRNCTEADGTTVCDSCLENYTCCEGCSAYFSDCSTCEADDCQYCSDCMPETEETETEKAASDWVTQFCEVSGDVVTIDTDPLIDCSSNAHCPGIVSFENGDPVGAYPVSHMWETLATKPHLLSDPRCSEAKTVYDLCMSGF